MKVLFFCCEGILKTFGYLLGGEETGSGEELAVTSPYSGETVASVRLADEAAYEKAIKLACEAAPLLARLSSHDRYAILHARQTKL